MCTENIFLNALNNIISILKDRYGTGKILLIYNRKTR